VTARRHLRARIANGFDVMAGVSAFPMRVKCATLAWHTMKSALEEAEQPRKPNERRTADMQAASATLPPEELESFTAKLVAALKTVYDPEIPVTSTSSDLSTRWMSPITRTWLSR